MEKAGGAAGLPRAERERRGSIARRYVAIDRPTEADDAAYAAELRLSIDSLLRLAAAWRKSQNPDKIRTTYRNPPDEIRRSAIAAATDPDLSSVHPDKRAETSRRIAVVRRYLALDKPTATDIDAAASSLGMTRASAERLMDVWLLHRRAEAMPGAVAPSRKWRKNQGERRRSHEIVRETFVELGPDAAGATILARATDRCAAEGIRPLGPSRTYDVVRELRGIQSKSPGTEA